MKKYIQNSLKLTLFFLMGFSIAFAKETPKDETRLGTNIFRERTRIKSNSRRSPSRERLKIANQIAAQREIKEEPETVAPIQETEASRPVRKLPPGARPMSGMGGGMGFGNIIGDSTMFQKKAAQQNNALINDTSAAENRLKQMEEERERSKKEAQEAQRKEEAIKKQLEEEKKEIDRKEEELETQKRQQEKEIQLQKERIAAQKKEQDRLKRLEEEKKKQEEELEKKRIEIEKEAERLQIEKEKIEQKKREEAELLQIQKERLAREEEERERLKLEEEERQRQEDRIKQELIEQELRQKEAEKLQKEKREREREEEAERKREEKRKRKELKRQQKEERERLEREEKERQEELEKLLVHKEEYDGEERLKAFDAKLAAGNSWMRTVRRRNEAEQERQLQIDHFISDIENTNPFQRARQRELEIAEYKKERAEILKRKKEEQQTELENQLVHKKEYDDEEGHEHEEQQKLREHLKEQERLKKENEKKEKDRFEEEIRLRREKEEEESKEKVRQENFDEKLTKGNNLLRALRRRNENEQEAEQKKRNFESNIINSKPFQSAFIRNLNEQRISNEEFEKEIARKEAARVQRENAQIRAHEEDEQKATSPGSSFIVPQETIRERTPGATLQEHYKNYEAHKNLINIPKEHAQKREQRREAEAAELRQEQEEESFLRKMWQQNDQAARAREEAWKQEALQQMANKETEEKNKAIESVPEEHTNVSEKINEIMAHKNDLAFLLQFKHEKEGHAQNILAFLADQEHKAEKEFFIICATLLRYHEVAAFEMLKEVEYDPSLKQIGFFMDNFMGNKEFRSEKEIRAIGILENEDEDTKKALFLIQQLTLINKKGETFISHFSRARTQFNGHNAYSYFTKNAQILFDNFFGPEAANDMIEFYKNMRPGNYKKIIINENGKYESHDAEYWNETKSYAREQKRLTSGRLLDQKARSR